MMPEFKLTPKDFEPYLLAVIGEKTHYRPGEAVPMADTFDEVCARVGVRAEDYGVAPGKKTLLVHRKIELAMRQLRGRGLTEYPRRGLWTLTEAGVQLLRETDESSESPASPDRTVPPAFTSRLQSEPDTEIVESNIVQLKNPMHHPYSDDPYIRSLGALRTTCFGAYSPRSEACKNCPLSADCIALVGLRKAEIAAEILQEFAAQRRQEEELLAQKAKKNSAVDEILEKMGDSNPKGKDGKNGRYKPTKGQKFCQANADKESFCFQCRETLPEGSECIWVEDLGILHQNCFASPK